MMTHLAFIFIVVTFALALFFRDRMILNDFLLNNFNIAVNKIFTYIELPFCVVIYNLVNNRLKAYNLIFFLLSVLVVVLSGSRGSLLILFGALGLILLKGKNIKKIIPIAVVSIVIIIAGLFISPYTVERLSKIVVISKRDYVENISSFSRLYTAQVALRLMTEHPLNGVGIGNSSYYTEKAVKNLSLPQEITDFWESRKLFETTSTPLKMGAELGITGVIFFFMFYYYLWRRIKRKDRYDRNSLKSILPALEIYVIVAFVHNFIDLGFTNYYSWFYYGIVIAAARVMRAEVES
jgi:O-antigen ligase